jgi:hypothetical protein
LGRKADGRGVDMEVRHRECVRSGRATTALLRAPAGACLGEATECRGGAWQVTFTPGLEGLAERLAGRKKDAAARKAETVWQAYLRRKAERKAAARARGRHNASSGSEDSGADGGASPPAGGGGDADAFFQHEADPFADPFFQARAAERGPGRAERARMPAAWQQPWTTFLSRWTAP